MEWAAESGIVAGYSDGTFRPDQAVTRQELAVIFVVLPSRCASILRQGSHPALLMLLRSPPGPETLWAGVADGLLTGRPGGLFDPQANATRAELARSGPIYLSVRTLERLW